MRPLLLALLLVAGHPLIAGEQVSVLAAASLGGVMGELARAYEAKTGMKVVVGTGATSTLAKQIEHGAPAGVFMSADAKWMDYLAERKRIDAATRVDLLENSLVVVAPEKRTFELRIERDFPAAQAFAGRMAIGDPSNVPAGIYAKEAFTRLGWWPWLEARLAPAIDVRAALRLVETGEADCGVVYATDARSSGKVAVIARIPGGLHRPVRYPVAATADAGPAARAFLAFLSGAEARPVYERHGFTVLR